MSLLSPVKILILVAFLVIVGVPFVFRPAAATPDPDALSLIIITPHNEQIRTEFEIAFDKWHRKHYGGRGVEIDWRTPGGTSEIRKQLFAEYEAAMKNPPIEPRSMSYDLLFGGGSYEHGKMKTEFHGKDENGKEWVTTISKRVDFPQAQLNGWYGKNKIGRKTLYDPDLHWFGTALSAFGIVYNRDILNDLGVKRMQTWEDLTHPDLEGWVALADPGQSGSICTTFEVILQRAGWDEGWRILQSAAGNSRYFANSSSKVPIDISLGEAAAGMCIDFYGRYQAQAIKDAGGGDRVAYVNPPKMTDLDPDPISLLVGAPHPELAKIFIEFCLSEEGQALWQYRATHDEDGDELGPVEFELRRMPIRRMMYDASHTAHFVDRVNPFELDEPIDHWDYNVRTFIPPLFSAMAIDNHTYLKEAWRVLNEFDEKSEKGKAMRKLFYARPSVELVDAKTGEKRVISLETQEGLKAIKAAWKEDGTKRERDRIAWTRFYRAHYREIVEMGG